MSLATHALVGVAAARLFPQRPVTAFTVAFASHFLLDAIPHWDYPLGSYRSGPNNGMGADMVLGRAFFVDLLHIGTDAFLGVLLCAAVFWPVPGPRLDAFILGVTGGMLPDALQFVYLKFKHQPFTALQRFHLWAHHPRRVLEGRWVVGVALQSLAAAVAIGASFLIR